MQILTKDPVIQSNRLIYSNSSLFNLAGLYKTKKSLPTVAKKQPMKAGGTPPPLNIREEVSRT